MDEVTVLAREVRAEFSKGVGELHDATKQIRALVHDSVAKLDNSFNGLRQHSDQQQALVINLASNLDDLPGQEGEDASRPAQKESVSMQKFVNATDEILKTFVDRIAQISQESMRMVYCMDDVAAYMLRVQEHLSKINTVVELTKGLALNARIVAARAGRSGEAFTFVATEIHQLASSSRQVSDQISTAVEETNSNIHSVRDIVKEMASKDMGFAMDAKNQVNTMMDEIAAINQLRAKVLRDVSGITKEIDHNVDTAISLLQFEGSVFRALKRIENKLAVLEQFPKVVDLDMLLNSALPRQERLAKLRSSLSRQQHAFDSAANG